MQIIKSLLKSIILHIFSAPLQIKRYITSYAPIYSQTKRYVWYVPSFPSLKTWCQVQFRHCNGAWKYWTYEDLVKFLYVTKIEIYDIHNTSAPFFMYEILILNDKGSKLQTCKKSKKAYDTTIDTAATTNVTTSDTFENKSH